MAQPINNEIKQPVVLNALENHGPLVNAIAEKDIKTAKRLIDEMMHADMRDEYDRTPLMYAVLKDCDAVMHYLFKKNADPTLRDREGYTVLHRAAQMGNEQQLEAVIKHALILGVDLHHFIEIKSCRGLTALCSGAMLGYAGVVSKLLAYGANAKVKNYDGYSILMIMAIKGHANIIDLLLAPRPELENQDKIDVNECNAKGWTALHFAAFHNQKSAAEALLKHGADINIVDEEDVTPLMMTSKCEMAMFLISHGAYLNKTTKDGESALTRALKNHQEKLLTLLIKHHANLLDEKVQTVCARELPIKLHDLYIQERDEQKVALHLLMMDPADKIKTAYDEAKKQDNTYLVHAIEDWFARQNKMLFNACKQRDLIAISDLLNNGIDPMQPFYFGINNLMYSALTQRSEVVELLLSRIERAHLGTCTVVCLALLGYGEHLKPLEAVESAKVKSEHFAQSVLSIDDDIFYPEMELGEDAVMSVRNSK